MPTPDPLPQWERDLIERESVIKAVRELSPRLAHFMLDLHNRVRELEHERDQRWNDAMEARERDDS